MTAHKPFLGAFAESVRCRRGDMVASIMATMTRSDVTPADVDSPDQWDWALQTYNVVQQADLVTYDNAVYRIIYVKAIRTGSPTEPTLHRCYLVEAPNETPDAPADFSMEFDPEDFRV